ncbi:MAG TPA: hypothetical protein VEC57_02255 [Candidatus Limnocylindrales bacterium]|nr:hypothetical protein [Candidatus Limnocylindrales bacterium]
MPTRSFGFLLPYALALLLFSAGGCGDGSGGSFDDSDGDDQGAPAYEVTASVVDAVGLVGALQFEIRYLGESGGWAGRGASVICEALTAGLAATNYPGARSVKVGLVSLDGIPTPSAVVRCVFRSRDVLDEDSFEVEVADASDVETMPLEEFPAMEVTLVDPL